MGWRRRIAREEKREQRESLLDAVLNVNGGGADAGKFIVAVVYSSGHNNNK